MITYQHGAVDFANETRQARRKYRRRALRTSIACVVIATCMLCGFALSAAIYTLIDKAFRT